MGRGGGSMRGAQAHLVADPERFEHVEGRLHDREVGIRPHQHRDERRTVHRGRAGAAGQEFLRRRERGGGAASISRFASSRVIRAGSLPFGTRAFFFPSVT